MSSMSSPFVPAEAESLIPFVEAGVLGPAEVHLAAWVARSSGCSDQLVLLAVAMAAWSARHGHSCATLGQLARVVEREVGRRELVDPIDPIDPSDPTLGAVDRDLPWPNVGEWLDALHRAPDVVVRLTESWDAVPQFDARPLVLRGTSVYLQRHWVDECVVASMLRHLSVEGGVTVAPDGQASADHSPAVQPAVTPAVLELLERLLPAVTSGGVANRQRVAADLALSGRFAVIAGGPGTGKTFSVARILAVLMTQATETGRPVRVALAAPTGKAAARLKESIDGALATDDMRAALPEQVRAQLSALTPTTVHRLLGPKGNQLHRFRHDRSDPLPHDVVVIDETSMVSAPLLARVCEALRPDARLVLIGDPDQLESVELGAVLGDMVRAGERSGPLAGRVVRLDRVHRYGAESAIAAVADAVRLAEREPAPDTDVGAPALEVLRRETDEITFVEVDEAPDRTARDAVRSVMLPVLVRVRAAAEAGDFAEALTSSGAARILCAHRYGPYGVSRWNELAARWMGAGDDLWYPGRPLLVTRNEPRLGLANGDVGVVVRREGDLVAVFGTPDHPRPIDLVQLEQVETAYAMTVHKSQGSEYPTVVVILPPATSPLAGRELLYTAVTRARRHLVVVGSAGAVGACVAAPAERMTGLAEALSLEP
ncbi:MAG: hypothetical protein RI958_2498 [Actinomycetota bacterium]